MAKEKTKQNKESLFVSTSIFDDPIFNEDYKVTDNTAKSLNNQDNKTITAKTKETMSSYDIVERFKSTYRLRIYNGTLYIFNGDTYECATKELIIALMQECLTAAEAKFVNFAKYNDAALMLLSRRTAGIEIAKIEKCKVLFENGLYDVKNKSFIPYTSQNFCLVRLNTKFKPNKKNDCPVFDNFLETVSGGDKQIQARILSMIGYCMLPEQDGKMFFVLGTAPNSGKSIIAQLLERLFGDDKVSHIALHDFDGEFGLASLHNKVLNTAMDLDSDIVSKKAVSRIKNLTGGDKIDINRKHKDQETFTNNVKFIFATNDPIVTSKNSDAFFERLLFIPFNHSVEKKDQDKNLIEKLWAERNGIIKKALKAARKLIQNNYIFPECEAADFIVDNWRYGKNISISYFINAKCTITNDKSVKSHTAVLYEAYEEFCSQNNFEPTSIKQFSHVLTENFGLLQGRWYDNNGRFLHGYFGITLKVEKSDKKNIYYNINI